jgi:hypothetical protein
MLLMKLDGFPRVSYHCFSVPRVYRCIDYRHQHVLDFILHLERTQIPLQISLTLSDLLSSSFSLHCLDLILILESSYLCSSSIAFSPGSIRSVGSRLYCFHLSLCWSHSFSISRHFKRREAPHIRFNVPSEASNTWRDLRIRTPGLWPFLNKKFNIRMSHDSVNFLLFLITGHGSLFAPWLPL